MDQVVLVDASDQEVGSMEKMEAHQKGVLHRAFSILLFNSKGEVLLQKRAKTKYHSGGLWTNTCCSHPRPGEPMHSAVRRQLIHEMGIDLEATFSHKFIYRSALGTLTEYELDHVYFGKFDGKPIINKEEVEDWKYMGTREIREDMRQNPELYSFWFKMIMEHQELEKTIVH